MALNIPCLAARGTTGLNISYGPPKFTDISDFTKDNQKNIKGMTFSPDGRYFAWKSGELVKIVECNTWQVISTITSPKVQAIEFSALGTYLMTWEPFIVSKTNPNGSPQLHLWRSENGELVKSFTQKRQTNWEPQWSCDEKICGLLINGEIFFYEDSNFDNFVHKVSVTKLGRFEISPGPSPYRIVFNFPGKSDHPSSIKIYSYGQFDAVQPLASKSFFHADRLQFFWNKSGTNLLVLTSMDTDKSNSSYYGKQTLFYMDVKGETSVITLSKDEIPIHAVEWSPKNTEFCVIYGFMPSKATLFNTKCEPVFEFGQKHRNALYYNPQGNILLLGGFGNLRGNVELWDMTKRKLIAESDAPDSTHLAWSPDGQHYMTATTAPRLRMGNGFKIWHYTGTLLYERPWSQQEELWEVLWKKYPSGVFPEKPISYQAVEGIQSSQPVASKVAYRPPSARGEGSNFPPPTALPSKAAVRAKKKREAKKVRNETENNSLSNIDENGQVKQSPSKPKKTYNKKDVDLTDDPEKNKKIKKLESKLNQIKKLKQLQLAGKNMEINQLEKIKSEGSLIKELQELKLR